MQGVRKPFNKSLNDAHDPQSKQQALYLLRQFYGPQWTVESYDEAAEGFRDGCYDIIAHKGSVAHRFNAKRKMDWNKSGPEFRESHGWPFKFPDLNIEERSKNDNTDFVLMFNRNFDRAVIISKKVILASPLVEKSNKYVLTGEMFYCVDLKTSPCLFMQLHGGVWLKTKRGVPPAGYAPNPRFGMFDRIAG